MDSLLSLFGLNINETKWSLNAVEYGIIIIMKVVG